MTLKELWDQMLVKNGNNERESRDESDESDEEETRSESGLNTEEFEEWCTNQVKDQEIGSVEYSDEQIKLYFPESKLILNLQVEDICTKSRFIVKRIPTGRFISVDFNEDFELEDQVYTHEVIIETSHGKFINYLTYKSDGYYSGWMSMYLSDM